jgi:hypothetical protein
MKRCHHCNCKIVDLKDKTLSKENFSYYIDTILSTNIYHLDLSHQENLDSDVIKELAKSGNASAIRFLNVNSTDVGYAGIYELLRLPTFGRLVNDSPTYHKSLCSPVSIIKIEIGNTRAFRQYENKKFKYPLPLISDFEITYGHNCLGEPYRVFGYKQIILLDHGKEL